MTKHDMDAGGWTGLEIAIVGMAGAFPGAASVDDFWRNLREGVESISSFTREELLEAGVRPAFLDDPGYVRLRGVLEDADRFDAAFFDLTPRDAEVLNPQHRVFLERAWEALENAGYAPGRVDRPVGVFAGESSNAYVLNLLSSDLPRLVGSQRINFGNEKDFLASGVSYRLNLRGPSVAVQTACSSSLVAVHLASQSLINGECDLALAGGVAVTVPVRQGYMYTPDGISSPDGHCRAFDAQSRGSVAGSGVGVVVLKRLEDALAEGDTVHAVIRGSAINNDGSEKVGYSAPGVNGQARVISEALAIAGVDPSTVRYVETHGTGTPLGDTIELRALNQVFRGSGDGEPSCAIGSAKTNVGHLDAASGVTGLIKATLSLRHGEIPPSLNFESPHPEMAEGPLFVNTELRPWERDGAPRRAGVSSFGIGGTNAHVVLEEAPERASSGPSRPFQLLLLSARTATALERAADNLARYLEGSPAPLADVAFTLRTGRAPMEHRLAVACADAAEGAARLREAAARSAAPVPRSARPVAFLFPGLGMHHVDMARGLYDSEPAFREAVDECCEQLRPLLGADLREVMYSAEGGGAQGGWDLRALLGRGGDEGEGASGALMETRFAQPAVFVTEYALARLWTGWGVRPRALLGHSLGEYVAATVAGVFRLPDALRLVALRAGLVDALPPGAMLAVSLAEDELRALLPPELDVAAVNTPQGCVVAGAEAAVEAFESRLASAGTVSRRLPTRHAFHSRHVAPAAARLEALVAGFELRAPEVPFVSNVTGSWITPEEAVSPAYWARHLCATVRFSDGLAALGEEPGAVLLEVGPGQGLGAWALQHPAAAAPESRAVLFSLRHPQNRVPDERFLLETLGRLWAEGVEVDWAAFGGDERRHRVPLPTYPFERERYWVEPPRRGEAVAASVPEIREGIHENHERGPEEMEDTTTGAAEASTAASPRAGAVLGRLKRMAAELTGMPEERIATDVHFFEAGIDSLLLLQAIQLVEKGLGVRVSLGELLEEITTLDALAAYVDAALPPEAEVEGVSALPAPPALYPAADAAVGDTVTRVVAQQLHLMAQLLEAVQGGSAPQLPVLPAAAPPPPPAPAPAPAVPAVPRSPRAAYEPETFVAFRPVDTEGAGGLTGEQREYLNDFMARYVERTARSKAHQHRYHVPLSDGRVTARFRRIWKEITYPVVGDRARGARVWDVDGNEYVDIGMGFGCTLFGHAPDFVTRAIQDQVERGYGLGPQSALAGRAAELVCEIGGNDRAAFCNSGTEAVTAAIRAARTFTGRTKVVYFSGSYHGWADVVQGRLFERGGEREIRPSAPGIPPVPLQDVVMLEYDAPESLEMLKEHLGDLALVMVEPVQSRRPDIQPHAFLQELRRITREAGVLLLFDELVTGFRILPGGAQAFFGVEADLVTYGKVVAGGLPIGVVAGRGEVMDVLDGGVWRFGDDSYPTAQRTLFGGAFFKHPLSMAVTCAVLEEVRRRGTPMYEELNERTARLVERMNAFFKEGRYPVTTVRYGSMFRFLFRRDARYADLFYQHLILKGVHTLPETGTCFLCAAHTDEDVDTIVRAVCESVDEMRRGGLLPPAPGGPAPDPAPEPATGVPEGKARALPLTEGQRQLWIESQMGDEASLAYVESITLRLRGALDFRALVRAVRALVARHDTLRTTFGPEGDVRIVHPEMEVDIPLADFTCVGADAREAKLDAWVKREVRRPFDLAAGPLVRFSVAALDPERHLLVISAHHAVLDGWSFGVVTRELGVLYAAARERRPADLPPVPAPRGLPRPQESEGSEGSDAAEAFWLAEFADGVPVLDLPTDRPRPPVRSYRGERLHRTMDGALVGRLAAVSRRHGFTLFNTLLAATYAWLGRLSGQEDVVVGFPSAGQAASAEAAGLVGYGINVLPLRGRPEASLPFVEHARRVRRGLAGALEHQEFSFPRLVQKLLRGRDPARPPLFSVMLNVDRAGGAETPLGDLRATAESNFGGGAKFDLSLNLIEGPGELSLYCDYATDLFDRETVEGWLAALERLLGSIAERPEAPLGSLDVVPAAELRRVVEVWGRGGDAPEAEEPVHVRFEGHAARAPDAPAVEAPGGRLTYAELDGRANRLARRLRALGVGPEARVGVCLERTPDLPVALLGVLKAGGAYLPLDPSYPAERLAWMLEDSAAAVLLTSAGLLGRLPAHGGATLCLDRDWPEVAREDAGPLPGGVDPGSLAYVIYTSGSTGRPKGVAVPHGGLSRYLGWAAERYPVGGGLAAPVHSSVAFDLTVTSLLLPLASGGAVVLPEEGRGVEALAELLERSPGFGLVKLTPGHLALLLEQVDAGSLQGAAGVWVVGGESLRADVAARLLERAPGAVLVNEYGPTEATVGCCVLAVTEPPGHGGAVPIGRPTPGTRLYVLDSRMHPVPAGVPGELYVAGAQVARGYLGLPGLTAERFVPDPFAPSPGARAYRTGDRARWRADGTLEFLGRLDEQVKVRGFRIEPGEVEAALLAHPGVSDAVVAAREEESGERRLVAYLTAAGGAPSPAELRRHLLASLPEHMVPGAYVVMEALPLTPNGKTDRRALPAPSAEVGVEAEAVPRTPTEEVVAGIWARVLGVDRVGPEEDFFELGGHSLLAIRAVARVREALGVDLPLRTLFGASTVAEVAERVDALLRAGSGAEAPPLARAPRDRPLPLSFAQQRLWFIDQLQPGSPAYNLPTALRLRGALDAGVLEAAFAEVVRRHEVLRTVFRLTADGRPVQVVGPARGAALLRVELSGLAEEEREREVGRLAREDAMRPFDLGRGPLLRSTLARLGEEEHVLFFTLHHVVSDDWSMEVLVREVSTLYDAFREGRPSPFPPLPVQYADYAAWQREWLSGRALERQLEWWKRHLAGAPPLLDLPTDRPRSSARSARGAVCGFELPEEPAAALRRVAREERATPFMAVLAALAVVLSRHAGQEDVVVGTPVAGRTRTEVEGLIGFFVNTLALRTDLSGDPSFRELLGRVREATLGAFEHQDLPFEKLVEELEVERSADHSPLFQAMLALQRREGSHPHLGGVRVDRLAASGEPAARFDLTLNLVEDGERIFGGAVYRADLWDAATMERLLGHLGHVLAAAARDPGGRLSGVRLLGSAEEAQVLTAWSRSGEAAPGEPVHVLIGRRAAAAPGAVAVAGEGCSLTYGELEDRAGRLASRLRRTGAGPEVRVGICLEPGVEMVVAVLGVLRAGAAYVPVDPAYPRERIAFVLSDSAVPVLLTHSSLAADLPAGGAAVVLLDAEDDGDGDAGPAPHALDAAAAGDELAYVIYTSGSTGTPKGVQVSHRNLAASTAARLARYPEPVRGFLLTSSFAFDSSVAGIFWTLCRGGTLHVPGREAQRDPLRLVELARDADVSHLVCVPSLYAALLEVAEERGGFAPDAVVVAGEECPRELAERHARLLPDTALLNEYGPTEATVWCTVHEWRGGEPGPRVPIGRPVPGARVYVLDASGDPAPAGVAGELYVGGAGWRAATWTGRSSPPSGSSPTRSRRSPARGCTARATASAGCPDGELDFLGRVDQQVKIRGFRIEPGEVEAALAALPEVAQAAVVPRKDGSGERRLVAYAVPAAGSAPTPDGLRAALRERLPAYMVPSAVVVLDTLPLTPNGKVDRALLPAPAPVPAGRVPPATPAERALAEVWEEVLGVSPVGAEDDFFALGGHSMLAVRLVTRLRRRFGVDLPISALFEHPTVRSLAPRVSADTPEEAWSPLVAIQPRGDRVPIFLVHPIGGQVFCYNELARHLGPEQPLYGLQARDLLRAAEESQSIEEMAAEYLEAIRRVWPQGPYLLGGWSYGGYIAFEMAQQLVRAGEPVPVLAILDTASPERGREIAEVEEAVTLAHLAFEEALKSGKEISLTADELRPLGPDERIERVLEVLNGVGVLPADVDAPLLRRIMDGTNARSQAVARYRPEVYPGRIELFQPSEFNASEDSLTVWNQGSSLGWRAYSSEPLTLHVVPGYHVTMTREPHVAALARLLRSAVDASLPPHAA